MSLGRKLCLFTCYVKQVGGKQWVAKGAASIQWRGESRTLQDKYKKGSSRAKKDMFVGFVETIVRCVEWGACRDR